jgi:energy-coupling factor transport system permease protein
MMQILQSDSITRPDSVLHRMDPRVKIVGTMMYLVSVFLFGGLGIPSAAAVLTALDRVEGAASRLMLRGLKPILIILIFTGILNILLTPGEVLWQLSGAEGHEGGPRDRRGPRSV